MAAKREEPKKEEEKIEGKKPEEFGAKMYVESARALREAGPRIALSVGSAIIIWLFGVLIFVPMAEGIEFMDYPVPQIISFIIIVALAIIILTVFMDVRKLTGGLAGVLAYEFGKATGEVRYESYEHYRTALDGIIYVIIVALAFLLFSEYLARIHPAIPAVILIAIVVWSIFAIWRSCRALAAEIKRSATKWADELEKRVKK